jgi:hypothetical protein
MVFQRSGAMSSEHDEISNPEAESFFSTSAVSAEADFSVSKLLD